MLESLRNWTAGFHESIGSYIGTQFPLWLPWFYTPLLVLFLFPMVILVLIYMSSVILYVYKLHRHRIRVAYTRDFWEGARNTIAAMWDGHGYIWHGYDIIGFENIPVDSPALLVYYHGTIPVDIYYIVAKSILFKNRQIHLVGDRFLFKIPGWSLLMEVFNVIPGSVNTCTEILQSNNLLAIAPGGVYEGLFGDAYYEVMWKNRVGFAKVALKAQVPIIPVFTENIREAFRSVSWGKRFWYWLYQKTKLPMVPVYGGFPVKLRTYIGKAIPWDEALTAEELSAKVAKSIEALIQQHQRIPGSILRALIARVYEMPKTKSV